MVYLLVIASLQAISVSLSSGQGAEAAAQRAGQLAQMRTLEHLQVRMAQGGNVTVTNVGLIPSELSILLFRSQNSSEAFPVERSLAVGASVALDPGASPSSSVAVVTSLGNVFASSLPNAPGGGGTKTLEAAIGGPGVDAQLYQNPSDPARFFLAAGPSAFEFSSLTGARLWSFEAGQGEVTDVLPLSDGGLYVSDGYYGDQFTSNLFRLSSSGTSLATYSVRLLRLWTAVPVQYPDNAYQSPFPLGSQPVQKGADALYAYYDGWFFSSTGPSPTTLPADTFNLAASDSGQFYLFSGLTDPGGFGCSYPGGNQITVYGYSATENGVVEDWSTQFYLNTCDLYPNDLLASCAGSGVVAALFSETYWSQPNNFGGPYQGSNPFLAVLSSSGAVLRSGALDSNGYTSVASDGTQLYLSIPSSDEVEVLRASGTGGGNFYDVGFPASTLVWAQGSLFAIAPSQVRVYDSSMSLEKAIDFSPFSFYSLSNSKSLEPQMVVPSFLVLNSTSYLALLRNSTGYGTLLLGAY